MLRIVKESLEFSQNKINEIHDIIVKLSDKEDLDFSKYSEDTLQNIMYQFEDIRDASDWIVKSIDRELDMR